MGVRKDGNLIVGGASHDFDYARLELLRELDRHGVLRVQVDSDFEVLAKRPPGSFVISYTCNMEPSPAASEALRTFVAEGGRWFALHATNSLLDWTEAGVASRHGPRPFFQTLGSAFVAHPPIGTFAVHPSGDSHPLVAGIEPFEVEDELYLSEFMCKPRILLQTQFSGTAPGFTAGEWPDDAPRPVMYINRVGAGEVLYLNLGHSRGHYDAPHRSPYFPDVERGSWASPVFRELLARSIRWVARLDPALEVQAA